MSNVTAKILLSVLLLPLAVLLAFGSASLATRIFRSQFYVYDYTITAIAYGGTTWIVVVLYWVALWRRSVRWTPGRLRMTFALIPLVLAVAGLTSAAISVTNSYSEGLTFFVASTPVLWIASTVIAWRETPAEQLARLHSIHLPVILCPTCQYNLAGQKELRCPECGSEFVLGQLLAAQPGQAQTETAQ